LLEGRVEAEHLGFGPTLWRIDAQLSDLSAADGDAARAAELRQEARGLIERIAASIDDTELRSSFLGLPDVDAVRST
jgi:hypothetical protein